MKYIFVTLFCLFLLLAQKTNAQVVSNKKHKIVLQLVSGDTAIYRMLIRQLGNIKKVAPNAVVEVVCHGGGIYILDKDKTNYKPEIEDFAKNGVVWAACENTMRERKIPKEQLLPISTTVPSGVFEVILKQEDGWSYLKIGY
ncbi:MAG: DsrE family protein [Thermoflexibacter sp.]|jgi:hypothetical protein|nr:DsrE family protein [Thermoflexibacter sp.]